jgi:hypothetical protein
MGRVLFLFIWETRSSEPGKNPWSLPAKHASFGHTHFSRPYLFREGEAPQYLGFKAFKGDSEMFGGANPKYWVAAMSCGIFLEYGLSKRLWPSSYTRQGCD